MPDLAAIVEVDRIVGGKTTRAVRYYLSSAPPSVRPKLSVSRKKRNDPDSPRLCSLCDRPNAIVLPPAARLDRTATGS